MGPPLSGSGGSWFHLVSCGFMRCGCVWESSCGGVMVETTRTKHWRNYDFGWEGEKIVEGGL